MRMSLSCRLRSKYAVLSKHIQLAACSATFYYRIPSQVTKMDDDDTGNGRNLRVDTKYVPVYTDREPGTPTDVGMCHLLCLVRSLPA